MNRKIEMPIEKLKKKKKHFVSILEQQWILCMDTNWLAII
jgi:hypothetical protein